jgi:hypothetical protein
VVVSSIKVYLKVTTVSHLEDKHKSDTDFELKYVANTIYLITDLILSNRYCGKPRKIKESLDRVENNKYESEHHRE